MAYSAGTIYLQVVPSFHNLQRSGRDEANKLGKTMASTVDAELGKLERQAAQRGRKSAKGYSGEFEIEFRKTLDRVGKSFADIDKQSRPAFAALAKRLDALRKTQFTPDLDVKKVLRDLSSVQRALAGASRDNTIDLRVQIDAAGAARELRQLRERLEADDRRLATLQSRARTEMVRDIARVEVRCVSR